MLGSSASTAVTKAIASPAVRVTLSKALASSTSVQQLLFLSRNYNSHAAACSYNQHHHGATTTTRKHEYTTSAGNKSSWNGPTSGRKIASRRQNTTTAASLRRASRSRPVINGEQVAFHVTDLLDAPFNSNNNNHNKTKPFTRRSYDSDLIVVLDMDECIIHSQFLSSPAAAKVYAHQLQAQQRQHHTSNNSQAQQPKMVDSFRFSLPDGDLVHVNVRPGLTDFLKAVTDKFETHIFTAAVDVYAKPLLDRLDPTGTMFAGRWYREHCAWDNQQGAYVKDLSNLPVYEAKPDRVVLVDNNPLSFLSHPSNGILVSSFYNDAKDQTLPAVWDLLQELDEVNDVRPILEERFGLSQALREVQQQSSGAAKSL